MRKFEYLAVEVMQRPDGKPFYLIQASAAEILEWSAVPRKKQEFQVGYQRKLDDRHEGIREYIKQDASNIIPTAVLIAVNQTISIEDLLEVNANKVTSVIPGVKRLVITVPDETGDTESLNAVLNALYTRLSAKEKQFVDGVSISGSGDAETEDEDESESESPVPPESYVAVIAKEFKRAVESPGSVDPERMKILLDYASLIQLPGMILDGQHRVYGAKLINEYDVKLPVVLLVNTEVAEQAFQFYVVNNKATKLTPTELRGTISTSLTAEEIRRLYDRFKQAGVSADTARWTHTINNAENSPFIGLVDFGFQKGFLKENVMFQVVSQFMRPVKGLKSVFASIPEWEDDEYRMNLFFIFWGTVKELYPNAWRTAEESKGGQILMKATMLVLQKYVFAQFASDMPKRLRKGESSPIASSDEFASSIRDELYYLPEEFFTKKWSRTDIDTSDGRAMLFDQITRAIQGRGKNIGNMQLFKTSKSDSST